MRRPLFFFVCLLLLAACGPPQFGDPPGPTEPSDAGNQDVRFPDSGIGNGELQLIRLVPNHGPFSGGHEVLVRGGGFNESTRIEVDGRVVPPADTQFIDANRVLITTMPSGLVGAVNIGATRGDGSTALLENAYTYDPIALDPTRGSISGGTLVTFRSMGFDLTDEATVRFGDRECTNLNLVSPTVLRCLTPAASPGSVDVLYDAPGISPLLLTDAFEYYNASDPRAGGLGGGPLQGTMNVSVLNAFTGLPVSGAYVQVGDDESMPAHSGQTSLMGQVSFAGDDLVGPQTVHVAKHCFENTTFVAFDAQDVTVFLVPWLDLRCGQGSVGGGGGVGREGAIIAGELIWRGGVEFEEATPMPWDNLPEPRSGWRRAAYVYATQRCAGPGCANPRPDLVGTYPITESDRGTRGFPYRIFVRPSALAVYAIAGLENPRTGEFVPYLTGVATNVIVGPGEVREGVDIEMEIPLDRAVEVAIDDLPPSLAEGPRVMRVTADLDLGGQGYIVRNVNGANLDVIERIPSEDPFRFVSQPALVGELASASYFLRFDWYTPGNNSNPRVQLVIPGIRTVDERVRISGFVGPIELTSPGAARPLPADRTITWSTTGGVEPSFFWISIIGSDGNPAWRIFVRGSEGAARLPNFEDLEDVGDIVDGPLEVRLRAAQVEGFEFNQMTYRDLRSSGWRSWSTNDVGIFR